MQAPSILFGNTNETRKAWKHVMRSAWNSESPSTILQQLETSSLDANDALIVLHDLSPGWRTTENVWHMNWVNSCWSFPLGDGWKHWKEQLDLVLASLSLPWYAIGSLSLGFNDLYFTRREFVVGEQLGISGEDEFNRKVIMPWLDGLLYWIDDVAQYSSRFRYARFGCPLQSFAGAAWMRVVFLAAMECRILDSSAVALCNTVPYTNARDFLLSTGHIVCSNGHLRLRGI